MKLFITGSLLLFSTTSLAANWEKIYVGYAGACQAFAASYCTNVVSSEEMPTSLTDNAVAMTEKVSDKLNRLKDGKVHVCDAKTDTFLAATSPSFFFVTQIFDVKNCR